MRGIIGGRPRARGRRFRRDPIPRVLAAATLRVNFARLNDRGYKHSVCETLLARPRLRGELRIVFGNRWAGRPGRLVLRRDVAGDRAHGRGPSRRGASSRRTSSSSPEDDRLGDRAGEVLHDPSSRSTGSSARCAWMHATTSARPVRYARRFRVSGRRRQRRWSPRCALRRARRGKNVSGAVPFACSKPGQLDDRGPPRVSEPRGSARERSRSSPRSRPSRLGESVFGGRPFAAEAEENLRRAVRGALLGDLEQSSGTCLSNGQHRARWVQGTSLLRRFGGHSAGLGVGWR